MVEYGHGVGTATEVAGGGAGGGGGTMDIGQAASGFPKLMIEKPTRRRQTVEHTAQVVEVRSLHDRLPQCAREN